MATKQVRMRVCDLHQGTVPSVETVRLAMNGTTTTLDLCAEHLADVENTFKSWARRGTRRTTNKRTGGARKATPARRRGAKGSPKRADVRAWAREQGLEVSDRGRIPADVVAAYDAAH